MIRYKIYYRKIKQVCEVILRDNENKKVVLEYIDRTSPNFPYKEVKKRIEVEISPVQRLGNLWDNPELTNLFHQEKNQ